MLSRPWLLPDLTTGHRSRPAGPFHPQSSGALDGVNYLCAAATIRTVHSSSSRARRRGRWAVGNAQRFPRGVGGCRVGGGGRQPSANTQFIVITHNKLTMEVAGTLYGVTMEEK